MLSYTIERKTLMKRFTALLLCFVMILTLLAGCKQEEKKNSLDEPREKVEKKKEDPKETKEKETEKATKDTEPEPEQTEEVEPEPEPELPDVPAVFYYTEYSDRANRVGEVMEYHTIRPDDLQVKSFKNSKGEEIKYISYLNSSWYVEEALLDTADLLMEYYSFETLEEVVECLECDGLKIYTAVDPAAQEIVENYFTDSSNFTTVGSSDVQPQASMVITDPETGDIIALVGGRGPKGYDVLNYATEVTRQPGSSIKPLSVYGPALEEGVITYGSIYEDSPYNKETGWPKNYPEGYKGSTQIYDAVRRSVNTIAVKVLMSMGASKSFDFLKSVGISSLIAMKDSDNNDHNAAALALGGMVYGVSNRELTEAYQVLANEGSFSDGRTVVKIADRDDNVIIDNSGSAVQVMSAETSSIMTVMLEDVVDNGTADDITLNDKIAVAGKTGTSNNMYDKWFVGYTPYYVGGVWFGFEKPKNLDAYVKGENPAVTIWEGVMTELHEAKVFTNADYQKEFIYSENMVEASVCRSSGKLAASSCSSVEKHSYFNKNLLPTDTCAGH